MANINEKHQKRKTMKHAKWPKNIIADRHEISGKWVLWYLTDEQAKKCLATLQVGE